MCSSDKVVAPSGTIVCANVTGSRLKIIKPISDSQTPPKHINSLVPKRSAEKNPPEKGHNPRKHYTLTLKNEEVSE